MNRMARERYHRLLDAFGMDDDEWREENNAGLQCSLLVYGTLMRHKPNYWLTKALIDLEHMQYRGKARLKNHAILNVGGLPAIYRINNRMGYTAYCEQYYVSYLALDVLDQFEGNGTWYYKTNIQATRYTKANDDPLARTEEVMGYVYYGPRVKWQDKEGLDATWHGCVGDDERAISCYDMYNTALPFGEWVPANCANNGKLTLAKRANVERGEGDVREELDRHIRELQEFNRRGRIFNVNAQGW